MAQLLGLRIENYRSLASVEIGQTAHKAGEPLPPLACFIGPNGSGKSSLMDAFGFMADCLQEGVEAACDKPQRGGFERLRTQGKGGPIRFHLYFKQSPKARPITYQFAVDVEHGVPLVVEEKLLQGRKGKARGRACKFLNLERGQGEAWAGEEATEGERAAPRIEVLLQDPARLGITTLGQLREHPRIVALRSYIENWYLSYFIPDAARKLPPAGAQKHLDRTGENLGNVIQYLERTHGDRFRAVLARIATKIPGIRSIDTKRSPDGRLLLRFNEEGYSDPFYQQSMSDGTLKLLTYLVLLEDPEPSPLIGIEEPENGLYHKLLDDLAREFLRHAATQPPRTQVFITTHSPQFVDALRPDQVWMLSKGHDGFTTATRTADMPTIREMFQEGIPLGSLWFSDHLVTRGPA